MYSDRNLIIRGPNRCGKSGFAEQQLESLETPLHYIGTLPVNSATRERIRRHRERRGKQWTLIELNSTTDKNIEKLYEAFQGSKPILLDGLGGFMLRLYHEQKHHHPECAILNLEHIASNITSMLIKSHARWILVDATTHEHTHQLSYEFELFINSLHNDVARETNATKLSFMKNHEIL